MLPACKPGKTKTLACPATSLSGALIAAVAGTNAASNCNSPSIAKSGRISLAIFVASTTLSTFGDLAEPFVEKLSMATLGSIPKTLAVSAVLIAISANS